ncbi:hypothetical protein WDU94_007133 [Cyamophila willieti]
MLTVLSTSQITLGNPLAPIIARDPRDHHIYSPHIQYAGDLIKNNLFDYSNLFPDYDYQGGARNQGSEYQSYTDYQNQPGLEYPGYQNSPNQGIVNQGYQGQKNSPNQELGNYQGSSQNVPGDYQRYNDDQTINSNQQSLLEMLPFVGGFFSPPSRSQQASYGQPQQQSKYHKNPNHIHHPITKIHINPSQYQTVPLSNPSSPHTPKIANDQQSFLEALASNPSLMSELQTLFQAQKQSVQQDSTGPQSGTNNAVPSLLPANAPSALPQALSAPSKTNSSPIPPTQGTTPASLPKQQISTLSGRPSVTKEEVSNPSQTLTTPRPSIPDTPSVPSAPKKSLSAPLTPSETELPPALPAGNVPLSSSLPAPSPVPAPPLAVPSVSGN